MGGGSVNRSLGKSRFPPCFLLSYSFILLNLMVAFNTCFLFMRVDYKRQKEFQLRASCEVTIIFGAYIKSYKNILRQNEFLRASWTVWNTSLLGFSEDYTFQLYVNGQDWNENIVNPEDFINRGNELQLVLNACLSQW